MNSGPFFYPDIKFHAKKYINTTELVYGDVMNNLGCMRLLAKYSVLAGFIFTLSGCQSTSGLSSGGASALTLATFEKTDIMKSIPKGKIDTEARRLAAEGIGYIDQHEYEKAGELFNKALKLDVANSYLHFLNALTYHLRAKRDESQYFDLAAQGYVLALKFDHSNWLARYHLGLLYLDKRKFALAQKHFAQAVLYKDDDPEILYQLATASYYAKDMRTTEAALSKLRSLDNSPFWKKRVSRVSALTNAALNMPTQATSHLEDYKQLSPEPIRLAQLTARIDSWNQTHKVVNNAEKLAKFNSFEESSFTKKQGDDEPSEEKVDAEEETVEEETDEFIDHKMVMVEVTIIRTEEDLSTSKGINLLAGLQLQFGDVAAGTPGQSVRHERITDDLNQSSDIEADTRTITSLISLPAIAYSLNIANSQSGRNEILARPTLVARSGQTSEFFSGVEVAAAATSGGAGDSVSIEKEIGVKLSVTPEFLPNDVVLLKVAAERTFLTQPSNSVLFEFRLDTSKTTVNANVAMKCGQTLILSGLSERETENNRNGVPFLQDIPILQYFFSEEKTRNFRKSVLILMTPRKAEYLYKSKGRDKKNLAKMSKEVRLRTLLEQKHSDWFDPMPATSTVFQHIRTNALYQNEFRTGDFPVESWNSNQSHEERMRQVVDFLYY